jgi:hypothetical protein
MAPATLVEIRKKIEKHIKDSYFKQVQAPHRSQSHSKGLDGAHERVGAALPRRASGHN